MSKILKNDSGSNITIGDTGITINNATQYTIPPNDYLLWAASSDVITEVGAGNLVVNDGSVDLSISDGTDLIKGIFPTTIETESIIKDIDGSAWGMTSFGEGRVIQKNIEVEAKFYYNINTKQLTNSSANGGTVTQSNKLARLQTSTATNGVGKLVTKNSIDYKVSQDLEVSNSFIFNSVTGTVGSQVGVASSKMFLGAFTQDEQNGIYFGFDGAQTFSIFYVRDGVETKINQANFSHDKLDGTGAYTPDWTKLQIIRIFYSWHGASPFVFQIQRVNGDWLTFHITTFVNVLTESSIGIPVLSLGAKIINTGNASNLELNWQAGQISILGGEDLSASSRFYSARNLKTVSASLTPIFSIRNNSTFASQTNYLNLLLDWVSVASNGNKAVLFILIKNGTLTGSSFVAVDTVNSIASVDKSATAITGGTEELPISIGSSDHDAHDITALKIRLQPGDTITLVGTSASTNDTRCGIRWKEIH